MAVTISQYDHTAKLLLNKEVVFANLKVELLNASATFVASHTAKNSVDNTGAYQVSGNGWASGGPSLASVAVTQVTTNDAMLDAADVSVTASGGSIGPAYAAFVYETDNNKPLWYIDFGQAESAGDTTDFKIIWNANGIVRLTY
jgi:hypothetical protein